MRPNLALALLTVLALLAGCIQTHEQAAASAAHAAGGPGPAASAPTAALATSAATAAPSSMATAAAAPLVLTAPARVETRGTHVQVNGTTTPGALLTVRGASGSPAVAADGSWTFGIDPKLGETNLTFSADDGHATKQVLVMVVRLASATFESKYTAAVPPHASSSDLVWYDPDEQASKPMYVANRTTHPAGANVHDLMVTWTRQTGTHIKYSGPTAFGFGVEAIDGVGAPLSNGTPPYWCYKVNGATAGLGLTAQPLNPNDTVTWEFAGCA